MCTHRHRRSPNVAVRCHSRMELRPPTARKSHPNFFAHCKRSTKMKKYKKTIIPNVQNTIRTQVTPMVLNYGKLSKTIYFDSQTPCERMIHVCLGRISLLLQNASNSNVKSVTSTSKKCHLLDQNTMWTNDSCMFWYVLVTNLWGSDLHPNSIFLQRVPNKAKNEAKNEAKTRPKRGQKIALETPQL